MNRLENGTKCDFQTEVSKAGMHLAYKKHRATSQKKTPTHKHTLEQANQQAKAKTETDLDAKLVRF